VTCRLRTAVLVSGRGSNMVSLIAASRMPGYPAEIVLVASNRPQAGGLQLAQAEGIEAIAIDHCSHPDRESFERELDTALNARKIELVCLAGFMRVLTPWFVARWAGRLLNIHPSLLPLFRGIHTHRQALAAGVLLHGCTVHFVIPELDAGPIVAQACIPVVPNDTEESLAARVLVQEHRLYPAALSLVASGQARLVGDRVGFENGWPCEETIASPPLGA
jgi:phosphoribosylglycinamide formyltransferase-1